MKKRYLLLLTLALLITYLLFFPVPITPGTWTPSAAPEMTGDYAVNTYLEKTKHFSFPCPACEDVAVDQQGRIYGGAVDGRILRFEKEDKEPIVFAKTKGRPLGMVFDQQGNLIVADADFGLYSFSTYGESQHLVSGYNGQPFGFTNDMEVGKGGKIYFTDASAKFSLANYKLDLMEHQPNGAFYVYTPETGKTTRLLDSLFFANGVAVSPNQECDLIAETGTFRINKYWLTGAKAGQAEIIIENLPGFPDGISTGTEGVFWIAIVSPRNPLLDYLMDKPFLRKSLAKLPDLLQPAPERYATVLGINGNGEVVFNLQDPKGHYSQVTNVREANGKLYFGTLEEKTLGFVQRP